MGEGGERDAEAAPGARQGQGVQDALNLFKLAPVRVTIVEVPFTVRDSKGNLISGLGPKDVRILEKESFGAALIYFFFAGGTFFTGFLVLRSLRAA